MNPFRTLGDYELFLYTLREEYPVVQSSTVVLVRRGAGLARVTGELHFPNQIRLVVRERLVRRGEIVVIDGYGYEVWQGREKRYWYDSQPHPNDPVLAKTHPHHKHIPPDMKHHRIPAPNLYFEQPNLPFLIQEIESWISSSEPD